MMMMGLTIMIYMTMYILRHKYKIPEEREDFELKLILHAQKLLIDDKLNFVQPCERQVNKAN